ncbi:MAG: DNA-3-methyladenine glycosylase [Bacteroidetes bacterium]|nr:DNA-3-methyladenine glycosylase [Bacteroidota bacterium]MBU2584985.1 DNA-3-methyladenine glycosylase [Bacteroidota bacterium]
MREHQSKLTKAIKHLSKNDVRLREVIAQAGECTIKPHKKYFELLVASIVGQQLSMYAARAIFERFKNHFAPKMFPSTSDIINTSTEDLRKLGLSYAKIRCLKDLCEKIESKVIHLNKFQKMPDDEIINELIKVKGIGVWTVQMFLIFSLGRLNVLPLNDLGIKKGIKNIYSLRKLPEEEKIIKISRKNNWSPYNSVASWYVWRSLEINKNAKIKSVS